MKTQELTEKVSEVKTELAALTTALSAWVPKSETDALYVRDQLVSTRWVLHTLKEFITGDD